MSEQSPKHEAPDCQPQGGGSPVLPSLRAIQQRQARAKASAAKSATIRQAKAVVQFYMQLREEGIDMDTAERMTLAWIATWRPVP